MKISKSQLIKKDTWQVAGFLGSLISQRILILITFVLIFLFHTFPLGLSDFWWHLNTGRWIWLHGILPLDDPFLYTSISPPDIRASQILRGYPLFQLLTFGVYSLAGIYALVVLKAVLMTSVYGILWNYMRRNGMHSILALAIIGVLPLLFFRFDDFRPQIFTFIFVPLVLYVIERFMTNERAGEKTSRGLFFLAPMLMLLWANLHGGFILGVGIFVLYWMSAWVARKRKLDALTDESYRRLVKLSLLSVGAALLNPAGFNAIWSIFTVVSGPFAKVVDEYLGIIKYFEFHDIQYTGYLIVAMAVLPVVAMLMKWRKISIHHILLLVIFLIAGIMSFRFSLLMVVVVLATVY